MQRMFRLLFDRLEVSFACKFDGAHHEFMRALQSSVDAHLTRVSTSLQRAMQAALADIATASSMRGSSSQTCHSYDTNCVCAHRSSVWNTRCRSQQVNEGCRLANAGTRPKAKSSIIKAGTGGMGIVRATASSLPMRSLYQLHCTAVCRTSTGVLDRCYACMYVYGCSARLHIPGTGHRGLTLVRTKAASPRSDRSHTGSRGGRRNWRRR